MNSRNISRIITFVVLIIVVIAIILLLRGNGDTAKIELIGGNEIVIYQNDQFSDPGYNIIDSNNKTGFYVNIDGKVDTSKLGIYFLKYLLYNNKGNLVSDAERKVIVLEDRINNVTIDLNGDEEEYFFINDYIDNGAVAYQGNNDISHLITIDSKLNPSEVGKYEVKYQIVLNNKIKETSRIVNIIDYNIDENVDLEKLTINLLVNCEDYAYTLLPDGIKEYSKDISYLFNDIGIYNFDIYLKSGSHKKYSVDIVSIDREVPVGTCSLYHENNKTTIKMNVTDKSGIKKYVYNGLEFYDNKTILSTMVTYAIVRAYDNSNNYTDFKCKSEYGTAFRKIDVTDNGHILNKSGWIVCGTSVSAASRELDDLMQSYGYKTRDAVAAAAVYLATYKYNIPYFWGGKTTQKGFDINWGCRRNHKTEHNCSKPMASDNSYCEYGLDCAGFTRWCFIQAGFDTNILRGEEQSEGKWGNFDAKAHRYDFNSGNQYYINQIKPGDIVHRPGHVGMVIGVDNEYIQVAEMKGPILIDVIRKSNGTSINSQSNFTDFVLFDDFYKEYGNS